MTTTLSQTFGTLSRTAAGAVIAASLLLSGCGSSDENSKAINQAKVDLQKASAMQVMVVYVKGSPEAEKAAQEAKAAYQKVIQDLQKAADSSRSGEAAAARILRAKAYARQADESSTVVGDLERQALGQVAMMRVLHDKWLDLHAQADALQRYDAAPEQKKLDEQIRVKTTEIDQAKASLTQAEQQLKSLNDQAAAAQEKARAQRDEELKVRNQGNDKSQTERSDIIKRANEVKRVGDGFDKQAADFSAQAGKERPNVEEIRLRVQRLEAQKLMLEAGKQRLAQSIQTSAQQAERARKGGKDSRGAEQFAADLTTEMTKLKALRSSIEDPADEAVRLYASSFSEAKRAGDALRPKAGTGGGGESDLTQAASKHAEADLYMIRASGLKSYADLMDALAKTKPALPDSAKLLSEAEDATKMALNMLTNAQDAFTKAQDLYNSAGRREKAQDVKDRLDNVAKTLAAFDSRKPAAPADEAADTGTDAAAKPADSAPTEKPAETPPTPAPTVALEGEQAQIVAMLQKIADAMKAKNYESIMPLFLFRNDKQQETFKRLLPLNAKGEALDDACKAQFGRDFEDLAKEFAPQLKNSEGDIDALFKLVRGLNPADLDIKVAPDGAEAEINYKTTPLKDPLIAVKRPAGWVMQVDFQAGVGAESESLVTMIAGVFEKTTENIKSGKYGNDPKKMFDDLKAEMMKAMMPKDENK